MQYTRVQTVRTCRSCGSKNIEEIITLGKLALSTFVKRIPGKKVKFPLTLVLCKDCLLVQLKHTTPSSLLYTENYGYKSGINRTMRDELREIVIESLQFLGKRKKMITAVDIGANDGTLLANYQRGVFRIGVEPIKKLANECKEHADIVINDFYQYHVFKKNTEDRRADIISIISCFYDMEDPNKFVADIAKILDEDGIIVIQQNYLPEMLRLNAFDNIVHEHLEYYSLHSLSYLLDTHNLAVFDLKINATNGGSIRTFISHKNKRPVAKSVTALLQKEKNAGLETVKPYLEFASRVKTNGKKLLDFIRKERNKGKTIYLYGASTRGNTLLQYYHLTNKQITAAVERNPEKWGRKIASVGIPIISEEQARKEKPDYMLVLPWFFREEFINREQKYLESGGHFIFPLPVFEIV